MEAAEIGTEKVIKDHATIGIVVTTDGSIGEISRNSYVDVEEQIVNELKNLNKPFIVIMNSTHPNNTETIGLSKSLRDKYGVPVLPVSAETLNEKEILNILKEALYEFPIEQVNVNIPDWIAILEKGNWLKDIYIEKIKDCVVSINKLRDVEDINMNFETSEYISKAYISEVNTRNGEVTINLEPPVNLYDDVLKETVGISINSKAELLKMFLDFRDGKSEYEQFKSALKQVNQTGYGIASPTLADMRLEKPEIIKQGGRYGVKLKAVASSIHMIKVDVESTFEPIIGSEVQSKELIDYLLKDQEENPENIWKSEIFGRSLDVIVQEGIQAKLAMMPENMRYKLGTIITKMVNKGSNNLIAIVL